MLLLLIFISISIFEFISHKIIQCKPNKLTFFQKAGDPWAVDNALDAKEVLLPETKMIGVHAVAIVDAVWKGIAAIIAPT